jgi:ABC-type branched-subunit amino acid transport system substrate-binding protein
MTAYRQMRLTRRRCSTLAAGLAATLAIAACSSSGSGSGTGTAAGTGSGPVTIGGMFPITGSLSDVGNRFVEGLKAGIADVNAHGGVLGHQLTFALADDGGDAVDAVPAFHQLLLHNPVAVVGPISLTFPVTEKTWDADHIVDFGIIPNTPYDHLMDPYVFHATVPDSSLGKAMAYYALSRGLKQAVGVFGADSSSQTLSVAILSAFKAHGGTVLAQVNVKPAQSSYRTELADAFSKHPQFVFIQADAQTSATIFADARQLGYLNIPWVGSDEYSALAEAQAMGLSEASKYLTGVASTPNTGPATTYFDKLFQQLYHIVAPPFTSNVYDAVVIASLAMIAAKSTNPQVWHSYVRQVADPPGQTVWTFAEGVAALKAGKKINYEGAYSSWDFNQYGDIYTGFSIVQWNASGTTLNTIFNIPSKAIENY